jgi:hypothetical protein
VKDLIRQVNVTTPWMEGGFMSLDDKRWVQISTQLNTFTAPNIFLSLPHLPGTTLLMVIRPNLLERMLTPISEG